MSIFATEDGTAISSPAEEKRLHLRTHIRGGLRILIPVWWLLPLQLTIGASQACDPERLLEAHQIYPPAIVLGVSPSASEVDKVCAALQTGVEKFAASIPSIARTEIAVNVCLLPMASISVNAFLGASRIPFQELCRVPGAGIKLCTLHNPVSPVQIVSYDILFLHDVNIQAQWHIFVCNKVASSLPHAAAGGVNPNSGIG